MPIETHNRKANPMQTIEEQSKQIRREGKILERFDREKSDGYHTGFFIEWRGSEYLIRMHNGQTKRIRKLAE